MNLRSTTILVLSSLAFLADSITTDTVALADQRDSQLTRKERRDKAARQSATRKQASNNIEQVAKQLGLSSSQRTKVATLLKKQQWEAAVSSFNTTRKNEIYEHAHNIIRKTIPTMMRKFMPAYMNQKISAQRRRQKRRGPPSRSEIARIQKDARTKVEPAMRKTVMPLLDKLTEARMAELLVDEKTMTRMLADRIIKAGVLGESDTKRFAAAIEQAGFPASLTTGPDQVLNQRTKKMLEHLDLKQIVQAAGL